MKLNKLTNIDKACFHGLTFSQNYLFRPDLLEWILIKLDSILSDGILSREQIVKKYGTNYLYEILDRFNQLSSSGADNSHISICANPSIEKSEQNKYSPDSFNTFVRRGLSIILNDNVLSLPQKDKAGNKKHFMDDYEIQIKDRIPKEFFTGILVGGIKENTFYKSEQEETVNNLLSKIGNIQQKRGTDLPIFRIDKLI